jgi:hypothetical protein
MVNADWFFAIGKTHDVCEDYAYAEGSPGAAIAVLSDGCSGSPDTDFGSRLLVRAAAERLWNDGMEFDGQRVVYQAAGMAKQIGLQENSLDATVFCAKAVKMASGVLCTVWVHGDGVVVARKKAGGFLVIEVSYKSGMPAYLSYLLNKNRLHRYQQETRGRPVVVSNLDYSEEWDLIDADFHEGMKWPSEVIEINLADCDCEFDLVAMFSDGIQSFQRRTLTGVLESVPYALVAEQVMALKGMKGEFLKRRCNAFLNRFCVKNSWQHDDDFSAVAIDLSGE